MTKNAIAHYESALKEAFPSGATGDVFHHWNEARKALAEQPAQQEPFAWADLNALNAQFNSVNCGTAYKLPAEGRQPLYTFPPAQRTWVDPNDKTQKQYLPHIGEPVLFCHKGAIYTGKHTGGSFQSEVTNQYFNTWKCHWMYLPAAHGIKE